MAQNKLYPSLRVADAAVLSEAIDCHLKELSPLSHLTVCSTEGKRRYGHHGHWCTHLEVIASSPICIVGWSKSLGRAPIPQRSEIPLWFWKSWNIFQQAQFIHHLPGGDNLILPSDRTWTNKVQGLSEVAAHLRTSGQMMSGALEPSSHLIPCPHHSFRYSFKWIHGFKWRIALSRLS